MKTKLCRKCGRVLPVESFTVDNHMHDHRACYCRECVNARERERKEAKARAIKLGRNPKLRTFSTEELIKEINVRITNAYR
jgi:hypothetical protein